MCNEELIIQAALAEGKWTEEEIEEILATEGELPWHTLQGWVERGKRVGKRYQIKKGEHGTLVNLWKKKGDKKVKEDEEVKEGEVELTRNFYMCKAYLFTRDQIIEV